MTPANDTDDRDLFRTQVAARYERLHRANLDESGARIVKTVKDVL
jgi:hypothetical protein